MFRILAIVVTVMLFSTPAYAQEVPQQPAQKMYMTRTLCDPITKIAEVVEKYDEKLLFSGDFMTFSAQTGQPFTGGFLFYVNQDSGSFTAIQIFQDGMACILGNGRNFKPYTGP